MSSNAPLIPQSRTAGHPLRVLAFFAVGIIIPSGFLSYLGFRSLQVENMLQRKQAEEHYAVVADLMQRKATEMLADLVHDLRQNASDQRLGKEDIRTSTQHLLAMTTLDGIPLEGLFLFDRQGRLALPALFNNTANDPAVPNLDWGSFAGEISRLEHLEFVNKNVPAAVHGYEALLTRVPTGRQQAALLRNIASGYRKLHDTKNAETHYLELIRRFDQLPDPVGYPTGILGRQLLVQLYEETSKPERALEMRLDLLEGLIVGQWTLSSSRRESLQNDLNLAITKRLSSRSPSLAESRVRWNRLQELDKRLSVVRVEAQTFLQTEWPDLQLRIQNHNWWDQGGTLETAQSQRFVVVAPIEGPSRTGEKFLIVAYGQEASFLQTIQRSLTSIAQLSTLQVQWGEAPTPSKAPLGRLSDALRPQVERAVNTMDPPLKFRLLEDPSQPQESARRLREGIFISMIGLSLLVIIGGMLIMAQAIRREIEVANLKSDFVANVSHELRTPLSAISYIGERLTLGRYRSPEELKEFYDMLGQETGRLREMIEDILDFSKMLDGRKVYKKEPQDLVAVTEEAIDRFRGKAESLGFTVSRELPSQAMQVPLDRRAAVQAVMNLLDNALKYSGESREIQLRLSQNNGYSVVEVQDFGIGIAPEQHEKIFEKFYRVEEAMTRGSEGGVGLGLAMVKHIMEGHGGRVTLVSERGKGSTFSLWFERSSQ